MAYFDFGYLCGTPLGPADYLAIARKFPTVFLEGVPQVTETRSEAIRAALLMRYCVGVAVVLGTRLQFSMATRNEARRFISLVDALYECKTKLYASFALPVETLFSMVSALGERDGGGEVWVVVQ
jgi:predicted ATPase